MIEEGEIITEERIRFYDKCKCYRCQKIVKEMREKIKSKPKEDKNGREDQKD